MNAAEAFTVVGLGELLWDIFESSRRPGGAPANVAFQAQQLGCRGVVCSAVGQDDLGRELLEFFEQQGLETTAVQRLADFPTGKVTVDATIAGHPEYIIHEGVAWDHLEFNDHVRDVMQQADAVCFGTLAQRWPVSRETVLQALLATTDDCLIVYDVNLRQHWYDRMWIERSLQMADIVKLNHQEVAVIGELLEINATEVPEFAATLQQRFAVDVTCVTRAEAGCVLIADGTVVDIPGIAVKVADAVGAGDAFTAGLIFARLHGWDLNRTGQLANRIGALVASHPGAMPSLREEFAALIAEWSPE